MRTCIACILSASLFACGKPGDTEPAPQEPKGVAPVTTTVPPLSAIPPGLSPLSYDQFSALIEPGTGCSFSSVDEKLMFVATAPVDPAATAEAVISPEQVGPIVLRADTPGGYDALVKGGSFTDGTGHRIKITVEPGPAMRGEIETQSWIAELVYTAPGNARVTFSDGSWSCGA